MLCKNKKKIAQNSTDEITFRILIARAGVSFRSLLFKQVSNEKKERQFVIYQKNVTKFK